MSRFSDLVDQIADQKNYSLVDVLLKTKVLAFQLKGRKFRQWVNAELDGYDDTLPLPEYRVVPCTVWGDFAGYFQSYLRNVSISVCILPEDTREYFSTTKFYQGIASIESLASGGNCERVLDIQEVSYLRKYGDHVEDMILNYAVKRTSKNALHAVLTSVRSRMLEFLLELRDQHPELDKDDAAVSRVSEAEIESVMSHKLYQNCTVFEGPAEMRDSYQAGQAGAMGPGAKAENINFIQILRDSIGESSLADLAKELERLRGSMLAESKNAEQDASVAAIAEAESAAKKGDAKGVLSYLKSAGKWALDVATKIGTGVASKAIEKAMEGS
ncbi:hypothetical protein J8F10_20945 [Gemmata sp. G18]|uniref:AbiTii domain-containing protein n=1 Tax=Gemmata palustris TaxID=2822762 RepID=A0ABS5BVH4_9BACT|nr:hypothetical protein [Gemmata palustris]MBP3957726.1 hypothetical protein [Gemmata palustris]